MQTFQINKHTTMVYEDLSDLTLSTFFAFKLLTSNLYQF